MKLTHSIRLTLAVASLACAATSPAQVGQATLSPPPNTTVEAKTGTLPMLNIPAGPLFAAVEVLSTTLRGKGLPAINVIYAPDARSVQVPEMTLQNVNGSDALKLIAAGAGCDLEDIVGTDARTIGYRIFLPPLGADPFALFNGAGTLGMPGNMSNQLPQPGTAPAGIPRGPGPGAQPAPANPGLGGFEGAGSGPVPGGAPQNFINFVGMAGANPNSVSVYSLGGITNTTKFDELDKTLRDILKAGGVSADAAKLAFHDKTNVLVVNAGADVHQMVTQFLDAMQKNVAAAAAEEKRGGNDRRELIEAMMRLDAEREQRMRVSKQLEDTESRLLILQRELDRAKVSAPKAP